MLLAALYPRRRKRGTTLMVSGMDAISKNGTQSSKAQSPNHKSQIKNHKLKQKAKSTNIRIFKPNHKTSVQQKAKWTP